MVEINNQRKAFSICWRGRRGTDNGRQKMKSWLWRHCRRRAIYWFSSSLANLSRKPKLKSTGAGRYQLLSRWWDAYRKQAAWKTSRKVRTLWHCSRLRSVALYLWLIITVISVRQSTVAAISGLHCRARWIWSVQHKARRTPDCKIQRSGRNGQRDWYYGLKSPRLSPLWLSASSSACHGLLIITVTPLPTKPSATKMPENWSWRTWQLLTWSSAWCCCARCKIHEGVSWC